ncbi:hypothetical protein [Streptomyces sp. NPDC004065]|uniref:hypothetical protein n=1 Tax=Streptomyces sp. NPDC004065 TaxID=3364689 RepID=UPI00384D1A65
MGIRMLNHRPAVSPTAVGAAPAAPPPPVPALAAGASTARIPADLATAVRRVASGLRGRLVRGAAGPGETPPWCLWADLARGYLALLVARLPRPAPAPTVTVFVATASPTGDRPDGPSPHPSRRRPHDAPPRYDD